MLDGGFLLDLGMEVLVPGTGRVARTTTTR
jgi:hypothetical protein